VRKEKQSYLSGSLPRDDFLPSVIIQVDGKHLETGLTCLKRIKHIKRVCSARILGLNRAGNDMQAAPILKVH
jgi:hypothetical protein